jgi:hypothetical protein
MPGSGRCARCGGMIALATAAIDVHPPRASRISRRVPRLWGRFWTFRQTLGNYHAALIRPLEQLFTRFNDTDFSLGTMFRCIVPGWAHRHRGNRYRARLFFLGYLALLLPGLIFLGTTLGSMLLGLAFATHVASASDALVGRFATVGDRLTFTFACAAALGLALYVPIGALASRVAVPIQIHQPILTFAEGDVLWYNPSARIALGDMVLYAVPETTLTGDHTRYILQNRSINRVTAASGQSVRLANGQLFVDGQLSPWQSPAESWMSIETEFKVPQGHVFIPPNGLIPGAARFNVETLQRLGVVLQSSVYGRIFFRSQPLWRISTIHGIE